MNDLPAPQVSESGTTQKHQVDGGRPIVDKFGPMSCHPEFEKQTLRLLLCAASALLLIPGWLAYDLLTDIGSIEIAAKVTERLRLCYYATAFLASAIIALVIMVRLRRATYLCDVKHRGIVVNTTAALLVGGSLVAFAVWLCYSDADPTLIATLLVLPTSLLWVLGSLGNRVRSATNAIMAILTVGLFFVVALLTSAGVFGSVTLLGRGLVQLSGVLSQFEEWTEYFANLVAYGLIIGAMDLLAILVAFAACLEATRERSRELEEPGKITAAKLLKLADVKSLLMSLLQDGDPEQSAGAEGTAISAYKVTINEVRREPDGGCGFSPPHESDEFNCVFSDHRPTADQVAVLTRMQDLFEAHVGAQADSAGQEGRSARHSDLLVVSPRGAGRTTTFAACATIAALGRAQRVLILMKSPEETEKMIEKLRAQIRDLGVEHFIGVSRCSSSGWSERWTRVFHGRDASLTGAEYVLSGPQTGDRSIGPEIMVGELRQFEEHLFGRGYAQSAERAWLHTLGLVIVDSVEGAGMQHQELMHVPFFLDKLRLVLGVQNLPVQTLIGCSDVTEVESDSAREYLARRFFGGDGAMGSDGNREHVVDVRPREPRIRDYVEVSVEVGDLAGAVRGFVAGAKSKMPNAAARIKLFWGGKSEMALRALESEYAELGVDVCSKVKGIPGGGESAAMMVFVEDEGGRQLAWAAEQSVPAKVPVVVFLESREGYVPTRSGISNEAGHFPVLASANSRGLVAAHLKSAAPLIGKDMPLRFDELERFGVERLNDVRRRSEEKVAPVPMGWDVALDPGIEAPVGELERNGIWRMAAFQNSVESGSSEWLRGGKVEFTHSLDETELLHPKDAMALTPARLDTPKDERRWVHWKTSRGLRLLQTDISTLTEFVVEHEGRKWSLLQLEPTADFGTIAWADNSVDPALPTLPVVDLELTFEPGQYFMRSSETRFADIIMLGMKPGVAPPKLRSRLSGLMSKTGSITDGRDLRWDQVAGAGIMLFGADVRNISESGFGALFGGAWTTEPAAEGTRLHWPLLTIVLRRAFDQIASHLKHYGRTVAFRAPRGLQGAVVVFVEPLSTCGTVVETLSAIFRDRYYSKRFFAAASAEVDKIEKQLKLQASGNRKSGGTDKDSEMLFETGDQTKAMAELALDIAARKPSGDGVDNVVRERLAEVAEVKKLVEAVKSSAELQRLRVEVEGNAPKRVFGRIRLRPSVRSVARRPSGRVDSIQSNNSTRGERDSAGFTLSFPSVSDTLVSHYESGRATLRSEPLEVLNVEIAGLSQDVASDPASVDKILDAAADSSEFLAVAKAIARSAGESSTNRERLAALAAFVQSRTLVRAALRSDMAVQHPLTTIWKGGNALELCVLYIALCRATGRSRTGLIAFDEYGDPNLPLVAVEAPIEHFDDVVEAVSDETGERSEGAYILVEPYLSDPTSDRNDRGLRPIGLVDPKYADRWVELQHFHH